MSCILSKGIKLDCTSNTGGIEAIWLAAVDDVTSVTVDEVLGAPAAGDGTVTALITGPSGSPAAKFYKFEAIRNGVTFEQPSTISLENGTSFYTHTITLTIPKQDVTKRNKIYQLASGQQKVLAIIKDMNGNYWLSGVIAAGSGQAGKDQALQVTVSNAMSGKAKGDLNGYEVTLTAELPSMAYLIPSSLSLTSVITDGTDTWV